MQKDITCVATRIKQFMKRKSAFETITHFEHPPSFPGGSVYWSDKVEYRLLRTDWKTSVTREIELLQESTALISRYCWFVGSCAMIGIRLSGLGDRCQLPRTEGLLFEGKYDTSLELTTQYCRLPQYVWFVSYIIVQCSLDPWLIIAWNTK